MENTSNVDVQFVGELFTSLSHRCQMDIIKLAVHLHDEEVKQTPPALVAGMIQPSIGAENMIEGESNAMSELEIFESPEFGRIRTVSIEGEVWLVGKDVADALRYQNGSRDINRHVDEEDRQKIMIFDGKQNKETIIINESGLYALVLSSKLPGAKQFKHWVTHEVIPSIRKHGAYMTPKTLEQALLSPDFLMKLAQQLKDERAKSEELERQRDMLAITVAGQKTKVEYFDALVKRNTLLSLRETAKLLHVSERIFIRWLLDNRFLFRGKHGKLLPYATRTDNRYFEVKEWFDKEHDAGGVQTLVTPFGREAFRLLLRGASAETSWTYPFPLDTSMPPEMTEEDARETERWYENQSRRKSKKSKVF